MGMQNPHDKCVVYSIELNQYVYACVLEGCVYCEIKECCRKEYYATCYIYLFAATITAANKSGETQEKYVLTQQSREIEHSYIPYPT